MIVSASLVQTNGSQRSFQPLMNAVMASVRSRTEPKVPRRMAWRVMIPKKISTMFSQDPLVGVKCRVIRGFRASHAFTPTTAAEHSPHDLAATLSPGFAYWTHMNEDIEKAGDEGLGFFRYLAARRL